jgi:hypothetical protein
LPEIRARGGELVVIGSGTPEQAKRFAVEERFDGTMVTDPTLEAYNRAGMKRSVLRTFHPKSMISAVRALGSGHTQKQMAGDPWQQGGVVVVSSLERGGHEVLHHAASAAGDPTDFKAIALLFDELARDA